MILYYYSIIVSIKLLYYQTILLYTIIIHIFVLSYSYISEALDYHTIY